MGTSPEKVQRKKKQRRQATKRVGAAEKCPTETAEKSPTEREERAKS